jgi:superfamily II DNA/RNA helicase
VVVACPGRLEDLLEQGDVDLRDVDIVVLDEADRMADMGFLPSVRRILDRTNEKRQTLLFSATLDGEIDKLVRQYQRDPARHEVVADEADGTAVEHMFWRAEPSDRVGLAAALVNRHGQTIVFSRTRHGADRIARQLNQSGIDAVAIHGSRSQAQRERALAAFTAGRASALVATDVAARGIHVDDVACVLHFDLPADPKDYVHRSGRTGRAGASGVVVSFVPRDQYKAARTLQRTVGLVDRIDNPDITSADIPARDAARRPTALEVQAGPTPTRSGGQGGGGRPRNGSARSRSGYGHGGAGQGGKPAGKKPTWRKRANAAKARSAGAGRSGR